MQGVNHVRGVKVYDAPFVHRFVTGTTPRMVGPPKEEVERSQVIMDDSKDRDVPYYSSKRSPEILKCLLAWKNVDQRKHTVQLQNQV